MSGGFASAHKAFAGPVPADFLDDSDHEAGSDHLHGDVVADAEERARHRYEKQRAAGYMLFPNLRISAGTVNGSIVYLDDVRLFVEELVDFPKEKTGFMIQIR